MYAIVGYTGRNCETDIDECMTTVGACLNGGRCQDAVNNFTCDCAGTGMYNINIYTKHNDKFMTTCLGTERWIFRYMCRVHTSLKLTTNPST